MRMGGNYLNSVSANSINNGISTKTGIVSVPIALKSVHMESSRRIVNARTMMNEKLKRSGDKRETSYKRAHST